ncbi:hypothetical protein [Modestobacter sp. URMC 112]
MSDERDGTTGFVDRDAPSTGPSTGPEQAGATAVPDPRTEGRPATPPAGQDAAAPNPADPGPAGRLSGPQTSVLPAPPARAAAPADGPVQQGSPPLAPPSTAAGPEGVPAATSGEPGTDAAPGGHPTVPVRVRPRPRVPSREQMIRMGPWAPVAGAAVGLLLGIVVVVLLAPAVSDFAERLSLVFVVLGMTLLGAGGTLLADEVRLLRRGTAAAEARSSSAGVIAGLLNGLTPARLLITASAFVLLLSAYVTTRG